MSSPLKKLMSVRAVSVFKWAARLFPTHRVACLARLSGVFSPEVFDAPSLMGCSGLPAGAVGGVFVCHGRSVLAHGGFVIHRIF
jgi:hypothetical protein